MTLRIRLAIVFLSLPLLGADGCRNEMGNLFDLNDKLAYGFKSKPLLRFGSYPTSTWGTTYLDPDNLGGHGYNFILSEKDGMVYACRAGHIDIIHVRIAADWTAYLSATTFRCLMEGRKEFSFKFKPDITGYFVRIRYPENWEGMPQNDRERIAREVSLEIGQYLAYTVTTWHEILTWFGYKCVWVFPEFPSAFSWEDSFSNLLGTRVAVQALRDAEHGYDEALTLAVRQELEGLGVQPGRTARYAAESVRGKWFSGCMLYHTEIKKRNLDIGLDDGYVTPTVIPDVPGCEGAEPQSYPVPNLDSLSGHGFSVELEIEPREWERDKILRIVTSNPHKTKHIKPAFHFAEIMDYMREEAREKYGYDTDPPDSESERGEGVKQKSIPQP